MALYDIIDSVSRKQERKTEFGDERIYGVVVGIVAQNYTQEMPGRLCVTVPVRDADANQLKWAKMAMPYIGAGWGIYFLPEKGDQVLLVFEDGNIEKPYVIGCIPKDKDKFLTKSADEHNRIKQIQTRNGSRITFQDDENEDGGKDIITVSMAQEMHQVVIDNGEKKISLSDKEKNCLVELATKEGQIRIHAEKKLELTVGDSVKLVINGESGTVKLDTNKHSVKASKSVSVETDGNLKLSGRQVTTEATSMLKGSCSGMVSVEGKPIKLGG